MGAPRDVALSGRGLCAAAATWMLGPVKRPGLPLAAALLAAPALVACGPVRPHVGEGRGVLLIAVDALRADHLSGNGYDRATTPTLDDLAAAGASFTQAFSTAPWNLPACASLLTGCDPFVSRRLLPQGIPATVATRWHIPDEAPRLAQSFLLAGWTTAAFVDHPLITPVYGFGTGFQTFQSTDVQEDTPREFQGLADLGRRFEQWLRGRERDEDWFAFVQLHDLERAWQAPDPAWDTRFAARPELETVTPVGDALRLYFAIPRGRWSGGLHTLGEYEARYDGAIARLDSELRNLLQRMALLGKLERTTICLVGTHGLGFGEAGLYLDHGTLHEVDLHVPLILRPAASLGLPAAGRVEALASLLDVAPTLLDLAGLGTGSAMHGESLVPLLEGRAGGSRPFAVARAGYQEGYAVIDERFTLELTQPWRAEDEILAASWYGRGPPYEEATRVVLRDRRGGAPDEATRAEALERLCVRGAQWIRDVERLRGSLQTVDWVIAAGLDVEPDVRALGPCAEGQGPGR